MSNEDNTANQQDQEQQSSSEQQHSPSNKQDDKQQQQPGSPQQKQQYNNHGGNAGGDRQLTARERVRMDEIAVLEAELAEIGEDALPNARRLLELEIHRLRWGVTDMVDLLGNRRCKIRSKVLIPQDQYPGVNFVGKLLGQGGASLKKLQEECNVKMSILGAGSMRNERKEQECLETGEAKYQHLKQTLHLQIDCLADPAEAYYRIGHTLAKVKDAMTPDPNELAQFYNNPMGPHPHMPPPHHHYGGYGPAAHQLPPHHQQHHHHMPPPPHMQPPPHHHQHNPHPYASGPPPLPQQPQQVPQQQQQPGGGSRNGAGRLSGRVGPSSGYNNPPIGAMGGGGGSGYGAQQQQQMRGGNGGGRGGRGGPRASTGGNGNYEGVQSSDVNGSKGGASNGNGNWHRGATPRGQQQQQQQAVTRSASGSGNNYMQATA